MFANETLFSSCRHIYSSSELSSFVHGINQSYQKKIDRLVECQESLLLEKQLQIKSLSDDLRVVLESCYVGKRITLKDPSHPSHSSHHSHSQYKRSSHSTSRSVTGTVLRIDPVTRNELVVMWHSDASHSNLKISELKRFELS